MNTSRLLWLCGAALLAIVSVAWLRATRWQATTQEALGCLDRVGEPETLRHWSVEFVRRYPALTFHAERVTNGPLPSIRGLYPEARTLGNQADPLLVGFLWDRHGAQVIVGTTNYQFTNSGAIMWKPGIYIVEGR
jgi:hypothetical protein